MDYVLGSSSSIPANGAKQFTLDHNGKPLEIFVVHQAGRFYAYENRCPHVGVSLNWAPDQFLNLEQTHIQCSTHGAQFRIDNGLCVWGPCLGQSLQPLNLMVQKGDLLLQLDH